MQSDHFTCRGCACLCDDITLRIGEHDQFTLSGLDCPKGSTFLETVQREQVGECRTTHGPLEYEFAIEEAIRLFESARAPLILGPPDATTGLTRSLVNLAQRTESTLTFGWDRFDIKEQVLTDHGGSSCTLGEMKDRADLVMFWNLDPSESLPRLVERLHLPDEAKFHTIGRRIPWVFNTEERTISDPIDNSIYRSKQVVTAGKREQLAWLSEFQLAWRTTHQQNSTKNRLPIHRAENNQRLPEPWTQFRDQLFDAKYTVVFIGIDQSDAPFRHLLLEQWERIARDVSEFKQIRVIPVAVSGKPNASRHVTRWLTGISNTMRFQAKPVQCHATPPPAMGGNSPPPADLCIVVGDDNLFTQVDPGWHDAASWIFIGPETDSNPSRPAQVLSIGANRYRHKHPDTLFRFDGVPVPIRSIPQVQPQRDLIEVINELARRCSGHK